MACFKGLLQVVLLLGLLHLSFSFATSFSSRHLVSFSSAHHWKWQEKGWQRGQIALPNEKASVLIALRQSNLPLLEETLKSVSDPRSPHYGQYLTIEELTKIVSPPVEDLLLVEEWLSKVQEKHRETKIIWHPNRDSVKVESTVAGIQQLLSLASLIGEKTSSSIRTSRRHVTFHHFTHPNRPQVSMIRTTDPILLSQALSKVVHAFEGLDDFPTLNKRYSQIKEEKLVQNKDKRQKELSTFRASLNGVGRSVDECITASVRPPLIEMIEPFSAMVSITMSEAVEWCKKDLGDEVEQKVVAWKVEWSLDSDGNITLSETVPLGTHQSSSLPFAFQGAPNYVPGILKVAAVFSDGTASNFSDPWNAILIPHDVATPEFLRKFYGVPSNLVGDGNSSMASQSVFEPSSGWSPLEVEQFNKVLGVVTDPSLLTALDPDKGPLGGEQQLDVEVINGFAQNITTLYWNSNSGSGNYILNWITAISGDNNAPFVHSTSWYTEETAFGPEIAERIEAELMKIGARGITMVGANGDYGANGGDCVTHKDSTQYPGGSPYFLSVGASFPSFSENLAPLCSTPFSQQPVNSAGNVPIVCSPDSELPTSIALGATFTTAGAFSKRFPRPWYQETAVSQYLSAMQNASKLPPPHYFNASNRGFSDVIGIGHIYYTYGSQSNGVSWGWNGGTSASAPMMAGLLSLANFVLSQHGKPRLGFVNPLLYSLKQTNPEVFNQISIGDNRCGGWFSSLTECCEYGFEAYDGQWSPVAGLGSINFQNFLHVLLHNSSVFNYSF